MISAPTQTGSRPVPHSASAAFPENDNLPSPLSARPASSGPSDRPESDSQQGPIQSVQPAAAGRSQEIPAADSLRQPLSDSLGRAVPDSLQLFGADSLLLGDSLFMAGNAVPDSLAAGPAPLYRPATAKEVFGSLSTAAAPVPVFREEPVRPLTGNPVFEGFVLLLAAAYAMLLYRHIGDIRLLLYRVSHDRASSERLMEDPGGNTLTRFLKVSGIIGLLFVGVAAARYAETFIAPAMLPPLPPPAVAGVSLLFAALWALVAAYQAIVLQTVTTVTLSRPFMGQLWLLKRTYFALATVVATPPLLLFALCPPQSGRLWLGISLAGSAVAAVLYVRETLHLFLSKKVPILHWFLYLCAVEIFPFSLLALAAVR